MPRVPRNDAGVKSTLLCPPRNVYAAVHGLGFNRRPTRAQLKRESLPNLATYPDRKIDMQAAVHGRSFDLRGIILGHTQSYASIGCLRPKPTSVPSASRQING